jgi:hypothetical protein
MDHLPQNLMLLVSGTSPWIKHIATPGICVALGDDHLILNLTDRRACPHRMTS